MNYSYRSVSIRAARVQKKCICVLGLLLLLCAEMADASDGHELWLGKSKNNAVSIIAPAGPAGVKVAITELSNGWAGKTGAAIRLILKSDKAIKGDGYRLTPATIQAATSSGLLYGVFDYLRRQRTGEELQVLSTPSYERRILNHWDNQNGSVERGYAGNSIFWRNEKQLPTVNDADKQLWQEYARANASIGINGTVVNNVNASPIILTGVYLQKVKQIADVLRPYGIKVYLSVNFASPMVVGKLATADPLVPDVINWWREKTKIIYKTIPDFGGFLVKANSEGQPGPQDYHRTHVDGANMLADILKPYGGIVMWRAFVYGASDKDRAKQAFAEFMPLDGQFRDNVIIQVKNGPIDFQPREPFSPLFGAMEKTAVMPEFQITKEYLGENLHLVYQGPLWEEVLKSDTYRQGKGSTVARCTDGSIYKHKYTAIAGVANIGLDTNWCGSTFDQANWYAYGRLAWDNNLSAAKIADEWVKLTFAPDTATQVGSSDWQNHFLKPVTRMMMDSREAVVNYEMPLGLHHIFAVNRHYGPGPWFAPKNFRPDWTPPYYHKADAEGIGFNRTRSGSNAVDQYQQTVADEYNDLKTCPEKYLLWFHHVPWTYKLSSGHTLWDELCYRYQDGLQTVRGFQQTWDSLQPFVDQQRFEEVQGKLRRQCRDAQIYKDACVLYFQTFSKMPFPARYERPVYDLNYLESIDPFTMEKLPVSKASH